MSSDPLETNHRANQTNASENSPSVIDAVRAFGVVLGPSLVLDLFAVLGTLAVASGWPLRTREGLDGRPRREVAGQHPPWAAAPQDVEDGVEDVAQGVGTHPHGLGQFR